MRKALNKMSKVSKIGACPLYPMGSKIWHIYNLPLIPVENQPQ